MSVVDSVVSIVPIVGPPVSKAMNSIALLRNERAIIFIKALTSKLEFLEERFERFQTNLESQEGLDILQEGILQATRAVSDDRKQRIASLVANSLSAEQLKYAEARKLLNIYNELTDPEIIWLIFYSLNPVMGNGPHSEWMDQHSDVLDPISRSSNAPQEQLERGALQDSYKLTLTRLGLIQEKGRTQSITALGRLLVRYIHDEQP